METVTSLYASIVTDLVAAGKGSLYSADANEPDPRYKSYGVRAARKKQIISAHRAAINALSVEEKVALAHKLIASGYGEQQSVALYILERAVAYFTPDKFDQIDGFIRQLHGWSKICLLYTSPSPRDPE